jgi:DNA uptake protein ComE-like DNA-binding protein
LSNAEQHPAWRGPLRFIVASLASVALAGPVCAAAAPAMAASSPSAKPAAPIDVNSASRAQLKTLPRIGDAEAERIIAGRPYRSKADLVEHGVLPAGVYLSIKGRIIAKQQFKPGAKPS